MNKKNKLIRNFIDIKRTKKKQEKSKKDERLNENLLKLRNKKVHKWSRKLKKESKINKYDLNKKGNISRKKRGKLIIVFACILFILLDLRVAFIQFSQGGWLQSMAYSQQTLDRSINPKRGNIYDATGNVILATSSSVETITVNPLNISAENKEKVARKLSELFDIDYDIILKRLKRKTAIETVAQKVESKKADELRIWMKDNNITSGINVDEDTKRYYPNNNLGAFIIGYCGSDNQGLSGVELKYNKELEGKKGQIQKMTNARGINIDDSSENYDKPISGNDIVLSMDANIQGIAEKYLEEACIDNVCTDGGNILIMDVNNGDILAMAGYPSYNLNDPFTINNQELKDNWNSMEQLDKSNALQQMWRNKAISDTYEPGSTFKLVTASTALQEGIVKSPDNVGEFSCTGYIEVAGVRMKCWRYYRPHGPESLREALMNSCNPVFIGLGQKIGVGKYYEYLRKYGFLNKTGIDLPGEANSIFLKENKVGPVELRNDCIWSEI